MAEELTRSNIIQLLTRLVDMYQNTRAEQKEIATHFPPEGDEFSLIEEIELLTVNLRGYASQLQATGQIASKAKVIEQLQAMGVLNVPTIARFYFGKNDKYTLIKSYIRMLDYLRLLLLE
ncbi:hypothetical protein WA1_02790 [Scytonema hofmannii PCC 7110]|uniref:Uncharacterized protein n=1 Tax=Scytonema hofmannii PCC 7110 TaxID=128403 RepID=A0A139XHB9_9CYAN|nr:hypothetical protein [Scytonema hofmannii]KYC44085.1 hypothetical protein WA1_02790 [Scytonema hofmannii PCC 7110]